MFPNQTNRNFIYIYSYKCTYVIDERWLHFCEEKIEKLIEFSFGLKNIEIFESVDWIKNNNSIKL